MVAPSRHRLCSSQGPGTREAWTHMYCIFRSGSVSSCSTLPSLIQRWPTTSTLLLFKTQVRYVLESASWTEVMMVPAERPQNKVSLGAKGLSPTLPHTHEGCFWNPSGCTLQPRLLGHASVPLEIHFQGKALAAQAPACCSHSYGFRGSTRPSSPHNKTMWVPHVSFTQN